MHIETLAIRNFKALTSFEVSFNADMNIIVGNNESGKSTILEALNLVLTGQLQGRSIQAELHPFLFNAVVAQQFLAEYSEQKRRGSSLEPPKIVIEAYIAGEERELAPLMGSNNTKRANQAGLSLVVELDDDCRSEFDDYMAKPTHKYYLPTEYYVARWRSFSGNNIKFARNVPLKTSFVDASSIRTWNNANKYVLEIVQGVLTKFQQTDLSLSYQQIKEAFLRDERVDAINKELSVRKDISEKKVTISMDTSSRSGWEYSVTPHLDDIPLALVGKGEQNRLKIRFAVNSSDKANVLLIEEPENHLSYSSLNSLINRISESSAGKQIVVTTHSGYVLNKLGIEKVLLLRNNRCKTLHELDSKTENYFKKLPGYDTLRMLLCNRAILVEGPSDELIVQKAFLQKFKVLPIEREIDVISVRGLSFKPFLDVAASLGLKVSVLTDNDGDSAAVAKRFEPYLVHPNISIHCDSDDNCQTLEPQLLKVNGIEKINKIIGRQFGTDSELLKYWSRSANKAEIALKLFETKESIAIPNYIETALNE